MTSIPALVIGLSLLMALCHANAQPVTLRFEVLTAEGAPAADAEVFLCGPLHWMPTGQLIASGRTDALGRFQAEFAVPDHWPMLHFTVVVDGGARGVGQGQFFGSKTAPTEARVTLTSAEAVKARLLTPAGTPAAGLEVWVDTSTLPMRAGDPIPQRVEVPSLPGSFWKATADAEGRVTIPQVPKGAWIWLAHRDKRFAQLPWKTYIFHPGATTADGKERELTLTWPGSVRGRVALPDGQPAPGCIVTIRDPMPFETAFASSTHTGEGGEFLFEQVPPATYSLSIDAAPLGVTPGWICVGEQSVIVEVDQVTDVGAIPLAQAAIVIAEILDAETGATVEEPLTFRLPEGGHGLRYQRGTPNGYHWPGEQDVVAVQVKPGDRQTVQFRLRPVKEEDRVRGTVVDAAGVPVEGASVLLMTGDWRTPEKVKSGQDGSFQIVAPLPEPGEERESAKLLAWDEKGAMSDPVDFTPGKPSRVVIRTEGFASVSGVVTDEKGQPISGARVQWSRNEIWYGDRESGPVPKEFETNEQGRFEIPRLWTGDDAGTLFFSADGYRADALRDLSFPAGKNSHFEMALKRANERLTGTVVDTAGKPVAGITVRDMGAKAWPTPTTDAEGRFELVGLSAGQVSLALGQSSPERWVYRKVNVPSDHVRLVWPDFSEAVSGVVVDRAGKPLANAVIACARDGAEAVTGEDGRFQLNGLRKGWFDAAVRVRTPDGGAFKKDTRLKAGMTDATIQMAAVPAPVTPRPSQPVDLIGQPAPPIQVAAWIHSAPLPVDSHAGGKVRILDFWGIECAPCLAAFPKMQALWAKHRHHGLEVIAYCSYPEQEVKEFLDAHPDYNFPVAIATEDAPAFGDYDLRGIPFYVVIGRNGKVVATGHDFAEASKIAGKLLTEETD